MLDKINAEREKLIALEAENASMKIRKKTDTRLAETEASFRMVADTMSVNISSVMERSAAPDFDFGSMGSYYFTILL